MLTTAKGTLIFGAAGAAVMAFAELAALAVTQAAPAVPPAGDLVGGAVTGGAVSAAAFWIYKARVDRMEEKKADKSDLEPIRESLREIREDVRYLVRERRLIHEERDRSRGEGGV
jgi:hypothetical protein